MSVSSYQELLAHRGHKIVVVTYGDDDNVAVECETCCEVLLDFDKDEPSLLDMTVANITVRDAIEVFISQSAERIELADVLRALDKALMKLELHLHQDGRQSAFKELRETFNRIKPKWFHK